MDLYGAIFNNCIDGFDVWGLKALYSEHDKATFKLAAIDQNLFSDFGKTDMKDVLALGRLKNAERGFGSLEKGELKVELLSDNADIAAAQIIDDTDPKTMVFSHGNLMQIDLGFHPISQTENRLVPLGAKDFERVLNMRRKYDGDIAARDISFLGCSYGRGEDIKLLKGIVGQDVKISGFDGNVHFKFDVFLFVDGNLVPRGPLYNRFAALINDLDEGIKDTEMFYNAIRGQLEVYRKQHGNNKVCELYWDVHLDYDKINGKLVEIK